MIFKRVIFLRDENNKNEFRCPIVPRNVAELLETGHIVYVQRSNHRIYFNEEYENAGAILTDLSWFHDIFRHALIIGLKCFPEQELDYLNGHNHVFFSHSFQGQMGADKILTAFHKSKSKIYDIEYFLDPVTKKRTLAFGKFAGIVGGCLGLLQYFEKKRDNKNISNLTAWSSKDDLFDALNPIFVSGDPWIGCRICVIGAEGRCGQGVCEILDKFGFFYYKKGPDDDKSDLKQYNIVFNCVLLNPVLNEVWIDSIHDIDHPFLLVDVSCDSTKPNNPFPIYNQPTSWIKPVLSLNENVDIIAIDNLPSLLPKDSSDDFSAAFTQLFYYLQIMENSVHAFNKAIKEQLIKSYPKFYCVNFQDNDRLGKMNDRFNKLDVSINFVDPVFKTDPRLNMEGIPENHKRTCSIMLQHLDSLKHFLATTDESCKFCIVCEDDILVSKHLLNKMPTMIKQFNELNLDVLLLGYLFPYEIDPFYNHHFPFFSEENGHIFCGYPDDLWGSQMYMVSRAHAERLIREFPPEYILGESSLPYNPDWIITKVGKRALIKPLLALEEGEVKTDHWGQSDFHQQCFNNNYVGGEFF